MVTQRFIHKRKCICYIRYNESTSVYTVCTGKPSDANCISWTYSNKTDAQFTANEFFNNYINR